jgi:hypothetical protein
MRIVIPTRRRINEQRTLRSLPSELHKRTTIVCPEEEAIPLACYWDDVEIVAQPDPAWTISLKRAWIMRECLRYGCDKMIMLDDDLNFATRISENDTALRPIRGEELIPKFALIEEKLSPEFPHVGFGPRQGKSH